MATSEYIKNHQSQISIVLFLDFVLESWVILVTLRSWSLMNCSFHPETSSCSAILDLQSTREVLNGC